MPTPTTILAYEPTSDFNGIDTERAPGIIRFRFGKTSRFFAGPPAIIQLDDILLTIEGIKSPFPPSSNDESGLPPFFAIPRSDIREIKYVSHSGQLVIRATGHEMIEIRPVKDPAALQWIAQQLRETLAQTLPSCDSLETLAELRTRVTEETVLREANYRRQTTVSSMALRGLLIVLKRSGAEIFGYLILGVIAVVALLMTRGCL